MTLKHFPRTVEEIQEALLIGTGDYKYLQIELENTETKSIKTVIRGYKNCRNHYDILNMFISEELDELPQELKTKLVANCPGGGNINVSPKKMILNGMSLSFGGNLYNDPPLSI